MLISLIFAAALDPARWSEFLADLTEQTGGVRTHMFGYDFESGTDLGLIGGGYDPAYLSTYSEYYCHVNPWAEGFVKLDAGVPIHSELMCPQDRLVMTEFYNDWILPQEDIVGGGGAMLFKEDRRMFLIGGNIRRVDIDGLQTGWMDMIALLIPHLQQAFEINRALAGKSLEKIAVQGSPDPRQAAILLVTRNGKILYANSAAECMLEAGDIVCCSYRRRFRFQTTAARVEFDRFVRNLEPQHLNIPTAFRIIDGDGQLKFHCRLASLNPEVFDISPICILTGPAEPCALVTITPETPRREFSSTMSIRYGLTDQESRLALRLAEGTSPRELSNERQVSIHTVRSQLKSAMSKTGTRRQAELVQLVERMRYLIPPN